MGMTEVGSETPCRLRSFYSVFPQFGGWPPIGETRYKDTILALKELMFYLEGGEERPNT